MRKFLAALVMLVLIGSGTAQAHQPVVLLDTDTTAAKGPLLVDGTVSFALRASFTKAGEKKGFRAQLKDGDTLSIQYLIQDQKPESALKMTQLPTLVVSGPGGFKTTMKLIERTKFFEPFSQTSYLYLGRYSTVVKAGVYSFLFTSRGKAAITVAVGEKEIPGAVLRGATPTPTPKASPTTPVAIGDPIGAVGGTPTPTTTITGYTMAQVKANNSTKSCWAVVDSYVYELTKWINSHPGGPGAIVALCGTDATAAFKSQHENQAKPAMRLDSYKLGPLQK